MADPIRVLLFALGLSAVLAGSLPLVGALRLGGAGTLVALWVVGAGQIVLLAELLSLLGRLDWPGFLIGHLLTAVAVLAWARRQRPAAAGQREELDAHPGRLALAELRAGLGRLRPLVWDWSRPALPLLAGTVLAVGLLSTVLALWVPPNSVDSLSYHLPRVGYYLQFGSLAHFPTDDFRQVAFPANAELLILWTVAFLRADWLANLPQLLAWVATTVAVYGLGRQVGLGARAALLGAGLFALLPQAVLQSTSTLNDLVVASFVAAALLFLLAGRGARDEGRGDEAEPGLPRPAPRDPRPCLVLAGAAAGLALGAKGTAIVALPGLAVAFLALFGRRLGERSVLGGALLGGLVAVLLGAFFYAQNWYFYGFPTAPSYRSVVPVIPSHGVGANVARTLYQFAFADLTGPLAATIAEPLTGPLTGAIGAIGAWLFAALGIPTAVQAVERPWTPPFSFVRAPRPHELQSGVGLIGGLMILAAAVALVWPGRLAAGRRLLGFAALSYLVLLALTVPWNAYGAGRFLLTGCAPAAPLLGFLARGRGLGARVVVGALTIWSAATGLYVARFNDYRPLSVLVGQDRAGMMFNGFPVQEAFFRELDQELGPASTVGAYATLDRRVGLKDQWEYPLFGPRFTRTVLPLVAPEYRQRQRLSGPLRWTNESLVEAYPPDFIAVQGSITGDHALPGVGAGRCWELPLRHARPPVAWELWRCRDDDPRSVVRNGDFAAWPHSPGPFVVESGAPAVETAAGWMAEAAGGGHLAVGRPEPAPDGEPFRLRLAYRVGSAGTGEAGIAQELPLVELREGLLVVDARVRADRPGAALLWLDDGVAPVGVANETTEPETLRLQHRVDGRARAVRVGLDASGAGVDAVVDVRAILVIPREEAGG